MQYWKWQSSLPVFFCVIWFFHYWSSFVWYSIKHILCFCLVFPLSKQNIHELRFPTLQFQDAKYRVPEPSLEHLHCGVWDSHLCLYPQPSLLLLFNKVGAMCHLGLVCIHYCFVALSAIKHLSVYLVHHIFNLITGQRFSPQLATF